MKKIAITYTLLSFFDLIVLGFYLSVQIYHLQIPFYSDLIQGIEVITAFEMPWLYSGLISALFLYLSLFVSTIGYLKFPEKMKWVGLIQLPLRILGMKPTIPFFGNMLAMIIPTTQIGIIIVISVIILIEVIKVIWLFKNTQK